jgi:hypothetical protein
MDVTSGAEGTPIWTQTRTVLPTVVFAANTVAAAPELVEVVPLLPDWTREGIQGLVCSTVTKVMTSQ